MKKTISSLRNPHVIEALRLRERRGRINRSRIIVDGAREIMRAVTAGVEFVEVFFCSDLCNSEECHLAMSTLSSTSSTILDVTPNVFHRIAYGQRAEGIVGIAVTPRGVLDDIPLPPNSLVLVLEGLEKPGNVGAVVRSADGAGVHAVILADPQTDLYNPNTIRASLGTIFTCYVRTASNESVLAWLQKHQFHILVTLVDGLQIYTEQDFTGPTALVLGSEASGLSPFWKEAEVTPIRLPMRGAADSLNVSATAAVLAYEAQRQRATRE